MWIVCRIPSTSDLSNYLNKMEINEATIDMFLFARWFGFAPYTIIRNSKDQIIDFKLNRPLCFYGLISYAILYLTAIFPFLRNVYFRQPLTYVTAILLYILWFLYFKRKIILSSPDWLIYLMWIQQLRHSWSMFFVE